MRARERRTGARTGTGRRTGAGVGARRSSIGGGDGGGGVRFWQPFGVKLNRAKDLEF